MDTTKKRPSDPKKMGIKKVNALHVSEELGKRIIAATGTDENITTQVKRLLDIAEQKHAESWGPVMEQLETAQNENQQLERNLQTLREEHTKLLNLYRKTGGPEPETVDVSQWQKHIDRLEVELFNTKSAYEKAFENVGRLTQELADSANRNIDLLSERDYLKAEIESLRSQTVGTTTDNPETQAHQDVNELVQKAVAVVTQTIKDAGDNPGMIDLLSRQAQDIVFLQANTITPPQTHPENIAESIVAEAAKHLATFRGTPQAADMYYKMALSAHNYRRQKNLLGPGENTVLDTILFLGLQYQANPSGYYHLKNGNEWT